MQTDVLDIGGHGGKRSMSPSWSLDEDHKVKRLEVGDRFSGEKEANPPAKEYIVVHTAATLTSTTKEREEYVQERPYIPATEHSSSSSSASSSSDEGEFKLENNEQGIHLV